MCVRHLQRYMADTCHDCGNQYISLSKHWSKSNCSYPALCQYQHDTIVGSLMGDGYLRRDKKNPSLEIAMTTKEYLTWLCEKVFPVCSGTVRLMRTARECAKRDRKSGFNPEADSKDYSDMYRWVTMSHPELNKYKNWYSSGSKTFPSNLALTPTVLKNWYCGDGSLHKEKYPQITLNNESENKRKIESIFQTAGLTDFFWDKSRSNTTVVFRKEGAENFFDYVGRDPLPGFEYKFP